VQNKNGADLELSDCRKYFGDPHTIMIGFEEPVSRSEPSTIANNKESLERD
jgi:hypothetical protein